MGRNSTVLTAFSVDHASRVTGLSKTRLAQWDKLGFFAPEYTDEDDRGKPYARVYSFTDLVGLKTLKLLRDEYGVPLAELRRAAPELEKRSSKPWSQIALAVVKKKVVFDLDTQPRDTDGQLIGSFIKLEPIAKEVEKKANQLRNRDPKQIGASEKRKFVAHNARVLAGTRIPIAVIVDFIEEGYSDIEIMEEYPSVKSADLTMVRKMMKDAA